MYVDKKHGIANVSQYSIPDANFRLFVSGGGNYYDVDWENEMSE